MILKFLKNLWQKLTGSQSKVLSCGLCDIPYTQDKLTHTVNLRCNDGVLVLRICDECAARLESIRKITSGRIAGKTDVK